IFQRPGSFLVNVVVGTEVSVATIIITESIVRRDLKLEDEEGIDCLPNSTIFEQLTLIGPMNTAWNEFSSTMASAIICLATNQKFNFSKFIFEDEAIYKELGDCLMRADTTASSLEAEQDSGNITKTRSKATPNESSSLGTTSGGGPKCQETIGNTLRSDEDRLKLNELMELCTNLQNKVIDLKKTKTTQQNEIDSLKRRVKKLEKKRSSRTHKLKRLYKVGLTDRVESSRDEESLGEDASKQGMINAIDADEDITLVNVQDDADNEMFDVNVLYDEDVFVAGQNENVVEEVVDAVQISTAATTVTITTEEITLAQALEALKTSKPKVKWIVFQEPSTTTTITTISSQQSQDKLNLMKKKDLREKAEKKKKANIALIEE
ncbi:hypothetical protein Tco_0613680, partial [Tanacetum coccineum]